jgi:hypothetical protein
MFKYVTVGASRNARLKLFGYYVQRVVTSRMIRHAAARATVALLGTLHGRIERRRPVDAATASLRTQGHAPMGRLLSAEQCAEALAWLRERDMVAVRIATGGDSRTFRIDAVPAGVRIADFPLDSVVHCPHLLALANRPDLLGLATDYLGYTPTITLLGLRWSFPDAGMDADVQGFHRDSDAASVKLLVYLTDVDADAGPHSYVAGTHRDHMPLRLRRYADQDIVRRHGASVVVMGPAGTGFFIDTRGIHKGTPPKRRPRLVLMVQYSLLPCLIYDYTPVPYRGELRVDPYINRLVVAPVAQ